MSYNRYYDGGWASAESGGTPITPEALNHMENGIINAGRFSVRCGKVGVTSVANTNVQHHVSFDEEFDTRPVVVAVPVSQEAGTVRVTVTNCTETGFDIVLFRPSAVTTTVNWIALGG